MSRNALAIFCVSLFFLLLASTLASPALADTDAAKLEGKLLTLNFGSKTMMVKQNNGTRVTLSFNQKTAIERNGKKAKVKALILQDTVQIKLKKNSGIVALQATGPAGKKVVGALNDAHKQEGVLEIGGKTVLVTSATHIARNGKIVSLSRLSRQDKIVAHVKPGESSASEAFDLIAEGPENDELHGTISAISGDQVAIAPDNGAAEVTVTVDALTLIEIDGATATLADLTVGMFVEVAYDPDTFLAYSIEADGDGNDSHASVSGTVTDVNVAAGTVTLDANGSSITLNVGACTEIEVNDEEAGLSDIQVGMPIYAEYDSGNSNAFYIKAGAGDDDHEDENVHGVVSAIDPTAMSLTITPTDDSAPVTLFVTGETEIVVNDEHGTFEDIQIGDVVHAEYDPATNTAYALEVKGNGDDDGGDDDHYKHAEGTVQVIDVDASTLTFETEQGDVITLNITGETEIKVNGESAMLADILAGQHIHAKYNDETFDAYEIETFDEDDGGGDDQMKHVEGMILAIDLENSTVTVDAGEGNQVTVNVTDATEIKLNGEHAVLSDLQVDDFAKVEYDETTMQAQELKASREN